MNFLGLFKSHFDSLPQKIRDTPRGQAFTTNIAAAAERVRQATDRLDQAKQAEQDELKSADVWAKEQSKNLKRRKAEEAEQVRGDVKHQALLEEGARSQPVAVAHQAAAAAGQARRVREQAGRQKLLDDGARNRSNKRGGRRKRRRTRKRRRKRRKETRRR